MHTADTKEQLEYSANFLFTLWKRVRKYGAYATGITQNVDDLLQSHTARTMLANNVEAGHGLIKVGSSLVPPTSFPRIRSSMA